MDTCGIFITGESIYDFVAITLSSFIVFHYAISVYYGTRMIVLKTRNRFGWCPEMLVTYESVLWVIVFSYILVGCFRGISVIENTSFGAIFIRPLILITSIVTSILQKRRYWDAYYKYKMEDELKKKSEQED